MTREEPWLAPAVPAGRPRRARWVVALAAAGGLVYTVGLLVAVRCAVRRCPAPGVRRLFALDAIGSLPRLFTTLVFLLLAALAAVAVQRAAGPVRLWWGVVVAGGLVLGAAKAVSVHSSLEQDDGRLATLVGGVALAVAALAALWWTGRRWSVPGAGPVTAALAAYAVAAIGLDQVTAAAAAVSSSRVLRATTTYLEEGGEAVTALIVLAVVLQAVPRRR